MGQIKKSHLHLATDHGQRLRGQVSDFGIVQLLQVPHAGRRTGELNIFPGAEEARRANRNRLTDDGLLDDEAKLYYTEGQLTHATFADLHGFEAVVEVLSWRDGDFEFREGVQADVNTIDHGLHTVLAHALKRCDHLGSPGHEPPGLANADTVQGHLDELVLGDGPIFFAAVVNELGQPAATASQWAGAGDAVARMRFALCLLLAAQHGNSLRRAVLEDEEIGTAVLYRVPQGFLIAVADEQTQIGAVSVAVGRTAQAIAHESEP